MVPRSQIGPQANYYIYKLYVKYFIRYRYFKYNKRKIKEYNNLNNL